MHNKECSKCSSIGFEIEAYDGTIEIRCAKCDALYLPDELIFLPDKQDLR